MDNNQVYIFNKLDKTKNFFAKSVWSLGTDIYAMNVPTVETKADEIIRQAYDTVLEN